MQTELKDEIKIIKERESINLEEERNDMSNMEPRFTVSLDDIKKNMKRIESEIRIEINNTRTVFKNRELRSVKLGKEGKSI